MIIVIRTIIIIIILPTEAIAKYSNKHVCVCVSVCVSFCEDIFRTTCTICTSFYACCLLLWLCPPPVGWRNTKEMGQFWGFSSLWQCIVQQGIWDPYKNNWTDRDAIWAVDWARPKEECVTWGWWSPKGKAKFLRETWPTSLTCLWIANWTGPCRSMHTTGADAW